MNTAASKIINLLENGNLDFSWLILGYKEALKAKAIEKSNGAFPHTDCSKLNDLLSSSGSPIQSWYLSSSVDLFPEQGTLPGFTKYLEAEIAEISSSPILSGDFEPAWAKAYFIDDPKMFLRNPAQLSKRDPEESKRCLENGISLLGQVWGSASNEVMVAVERLAFFDGVHAYSGGSTPRSFGVIYQSVHNQDPVTYANTLVHEIGHHLLNIFRSVDQILLTKSDFPLFSPLRNSYRPAWGVVHSAFSMTRMLEFCTLSRKTLTGDELNKANELYNFFLERQIPTLEILKSLEWSEFGVRLFKYMVSHLEHLKLSA